jgi:hypothetical protein
MLTYTEGRNIMGMVHRAIRYFRACGNYISKKAERYIVEELDEDLFPYGEEGCSMETIFYTVWEYVDGISSGEINIYRSLEDRIQDRYERLKEKHHRLLDEMKSWGDENRPF